MLTRSTPSSTAEGGCWSAALGQISPDNIVGVMLQCEKNWTMVAGFVQDDLQKKSRTCWTRPDKKVDKSKEERPTSPQDGPHFEVMPNGGPGVGTQGLETGREF